MSAPRLEVAPGVTLGRVDTTRPSGVNVAGFSFLTLKHISHTRYGPTDLETWAASHRLDARAVTAGSWLPVELYYSLVETLLERHHAGDPRAATDLAGECARHEINGLYRFVLSFSSPLMVLRLSSRFWRQYYDRTELVVTESVGASLHAELRHWPVMTATAAYFLCGAALPWLQASRAPDIAFTQLEFAAPGLLKLAAAW